MQFLITLIFVQQPNLNLKFSESNQCKRESFKLMSRYHVYFVGIEVIFFLFFPQVYCVTLLVEIMGKKTDLS